MTLLKREKGKEQFSGKSSLPKFTTIAIWGVYIMNNVDGTTVIYLHGGTLHCYEG